MPWLPSYQELRDHPKTRKAAHLLGIERPQMIGHLHCLWWWALSYASDGSLEHFDVTDLALAAEWPGDPDKFVSALIDCGSGNRSGFVDRDGMTLHDWPEYGGRYVQQSASGALGNHVRWHVRGERVDADCPLCVAPESGASPPGIGGDIGGESGPESIEKEKKEKAFSRARAVPADWQPSEAHQRLATSLRVNLSVEAEQFRDYHAAKGSTFKDWDAAFRTWLRNAAKFQAERAPKNDNGSGFHAPSGAAPA